MYRELKALTQASSLSAVEGEPNLKGGHKNLEIGAVFVWPNILHMSLGLWQLLHEGNSIMNLNMGPRQRPRLYGHHDQCRGCVAHCLISGSDTLMANPPMGRSTLPTIARHRSQPRCVGLSAATIHPLLLPGGKSLLTFLVYVGRLSTRRRILSRHRRRHGYLLLYHRIITELVSVPRR
jgi:hypothetical protein